MLNYYSLKSQQHQQRQQHGTQQLHLQQQQKNQQIQPQQHSHQEDTVQDQEEERTPLKNWEVDLIEEVRSHECLWNVKCRAYKETPKKS